MLFFSFFFLGTYSFVLQVQKWQYYSHIWVGVTYERNFKHMICMLDASAKNILLMWKSTIPDPLCQTCPCWEYLLGHVESSCWAMFRLCRRRGVVLLPGHSLRTLLESSLTKSFIENMLSIDRRSFPISHTNSP
jgi:hypothetical protein